MYTKPDQIDSIQGNRFNMKKIDNTPSIKQSRSPHKQASNSRPLTSDNQHEQAISAGIVSHSSVFNSRKTTKQKNQPLPEIKRTKNPQKTDTLFQFMQNSQEF